MFFPLQRYKVAGNSCFLEVLLLLLKSTINRKENLTILLKKINNGKAS